MEKFSVILENMEMRMVEVVKQVVTLCTLLLS